MATREEITLCDGNRHPTKIEWSDIGSDGHETIRTGHLWSVAPPLSGMRTWWALPTDAFARDGEVCRVALASRRHRVGRAALNGNRYFEGSGRYVDRGEWFRETDARSRFADAGAPPPTSISGRPRTSIARTNLALFEAIIDTYAQDEA